MPLCNMYIYIDNYTAYMIWHSIYIYCIHDMCLFPFVISYSFTQVTWYWIQSNVVWSQPPLKMTDTLYTCIHLSNEKKPWLVGLYRDFTTQLYRDYNNPLYGSLLTNQYNGKSLGGFFSWLIWVSITMMVPLDVKLGLSCSLWGDFDLKELTVNNGPFLYLLRLVIYPVFTRFWYGNIYSTLARTKSQLKRCRRCQGTSR